LILQASRLRFRFHAFASSCICSMAGIRSARIPCQNTRVVPAYQHDKPRLVFPHEGSEQVSLRFSLKGYLKPLLHKSLPQFLYPRRCMPARSAISPSAYPSLARNNVWDEFVFLSAVFPLVEDVMKRLFFIVRQCYPVSFSWHRFPPFWFLCQPV
jgi:hypothetical protein